HVVDGFKKACQHGQWRTQFVRYVGDEILAGRLKLFELRHISCDDQELLDAIAGELYQQRTVPAVTSQVQQQRFVPVVPTRIRCKLWRAQNIEDAEAAVGFQVQAGMFGRHRIAPGDVHFLVQRNCTVRQGARCEHDAVDIPAQFVDFLTIGTQFSVDGGQYFIPRADRRRGRGIQVLYPSFDLRQLDAADEYHADQTECQDRPAGLGIDPLTN